MDGDFIGNFPKVDPNCAGCGKPLAIENAWMTDGCPCNTPLGVNNMNETRWRLLMRLQQNQSFEVERLKKALRDIDATKLGASANDSGQTSVLASFKKVRDIASAALGIKTN